MENFTNEGVEITEVQVLPDQSSLSILSKAEIDTQIATAKAFPRSITGFLKKVESIATVSESVAESCTYALPRREKDKKTGQWVEKFIQGPSVRLAEIVACSYGNLRAGARVISNDGRYITAQGFCHDLETNTWTALEVKRKITTKDGRTFTEDMQVVTGNAACKIAYRNAVFTVVPAALLGDVYEKVQEVAKGTAETLVKRREKAIKYFNEKFGVSNEQILDVLEVKAIEDIDLEKLFILSGMKSIIVNKESTVEELFPTREQRDRANKANEDALKGIQDLTKKATLKEKKDENK